MLLGAKDGIAKLYYRDRGYMPVTKYIRPDLDPHPRDEDGDIIVRPVQLIPRPEQVARVTGVAMQLD